MNFLSLLEAKRDGKAFTESEIAWLLAEFAAAKVPDYQMAALLMAILFRGLNPKETRAWTFAMQNSGEVLRFPDDPRPLVDKHSTGGVGDKVSLVLAPLLACLGFRVPMISGRGLGITGGTLDKLESIPGFKTALSTDQIVDQVQSIGCVICGQTDRMVPADKRLYALRDVTGTVPSVPLITASILSKKLAESLRALVLDVKFGSAAFMKTEAQAAELARSMVQLGNEAGVRTRALLTDMNTPLGRAAGNWLEVREAVQCLEGKGPPDLEVLVIECAAHLLVQTEKAKDLAAARNSALKSLRGREPLRIWREMLAAQGADLEAYRDKLNREVAAQVIEIHSCSSGFIHSCNAFALGEIVRDLGAGRVQKDTRVDPDAGIDRIAKPGDRVAAGDLLCRVHARTIRDDVEQRILASFTISGSPSQPQPLIRAVVEA
jgi:pyrimidine-nucleoside phosphorylase